MARGGREPVRLYLIFLSHVAACPYANNYNWEFLIYVEAKKRLFRLYQRLFFSLLIEIRAKFTIIFMSKANVGVARSKLGKVYAGGCTGFVADVLGKPQKHSS